MLAQAYERHNTRQAEKILQFSPCWRRSTVSRGDSDRVFFTGSGAGIIAPLVGGEAGGRRCRRQSTFILTSVSVAKLAARI